LALVSGSTFLVVLDTLASRSSSDQTVTYCNARAGGAFHELRYQMVLVTRWQPESSVLDNKGKRWVDAIRAAEVPDLVPATVYQRFPRVMRSPTRRFPDSTPARGHSDTNWN
jgi:hypothetical protein